MSDKKRRSSILANDKAEQISNSKEFLEAYVNIVNMASLNYDQGSSDKENRSSVLNTMIFPENKSKGRFTASMLVFGEEPVFSDSDEEVEYHKKVLKMQDLEITSSGVPTTANVAVQCEIISNETTLKNLIEECAKFNIEDVIEEFKLVVLHCKNLQNMYGDNIPPLYERRNVCINNDEATGSQLSRDEPDMMMSKEHSNSPGTSKQALPRKTRRSNNSFSSESSDADTSKPNVKGITDTFGQEGSSRGNVLRRSTRSSNSGKSQGKPTYKTINTMRYETRLRKSSSNVKTLYSKGDPTSVSTTSSDTGQKRSSTESIATTRIKKARKETPEVDENTTAEPNMKGSQNTKRKLSRLTVEYIAGKFANCNLSILLPKRKARAMGKNWKNSRRILRAHDIPVPLTNCNSRNSCQETHRVRRLYSPTEWLLSKEFGSLVEPDIKHHPYVPNIH